MKHIADVVCIGRHSAQIIRSFSQLHRQPIVLFALSLLARFPADDTQLIGRDTRIVERTDPLEILHG